MLTNTANIVGAVSDPNPDNDSSSVTTTVASLAVLQIGKVDLFDPVAPGGPVLYQVVVTNTGPSVAHNLIVTDTLPSSVRFQSATPGCTHDGSGTGGNISCVLTSLGVNQRTSFLFSVYASPSAISGTVVHNDVVAVADNAVQVAASADTTVQESFGPSADLVVSKTGPATATAGEVVTYTVVITNTGPGIATNADLKENLPTGITLSEISTSQGVCAGPICQFGNLQINQPVTVTVVGMVSAAASGLLTNTATAVSSNPDPDGVNNVSSVGTTVSVDDSLGILKVAPSVVVPNGAIAYQIVVSNTGPSDATNVVVSDTLPVEVENAIASSSSGSCSISAGLLTCTIARLSRGRAGGHRHQRLREHLTQRGRLPTQQP